MKYVSLDIETTSLEPHEDHILMVSLIVEDSEYPEIPVEELPHFTCFVKHKTITGQPYALAMNDWILDIISGRNKNPAYEVLHPETWEKYARIFLNEHFDNNSRITVAGKNVAGFDLMFLPTELKNMFRHRVIDVGPMFLDFKTDRFVPDLATVKARAGIFTPVAHDAREDAMDIIRVLRTKY